MPRNYDDKAQKAYAKLLAKGRVVTVRQLASTPADPNKPWRGASAPRPGATVDCPVVQASPSEPALGFLTKTNDTFKSCDIIFIAAAPLGQDITDFDEVVDGTTVYRILTTDKLQPGEGSAVLYYLGVSK